MAPRKTFKRVNRTRRLRIRRKLNKRSPSNKRSNANKRSHKRVRKSIRRMRGGVNPPPSLKKGSDLYEHTRSGLKKININISTLYNEYTDDPYFILLEACKESCDALHPFVQFAYEIINGLKTLDITGIDLTKKKGDGSAFSIVDGMVQYILKKHLFKDHKFFVGEEGAIISEAEESYAIDENPIPDIFTKLIRDASDKIDIISETIFKNSDVVNILNKLTIFVDPIDGTAEFVGDNKSGGEWPIDGKGHEATICIGFADQTEHFNSVAGFVYRPVINDGNKNITYALGWNEHGKGYYDISHLNIDKTLHDINKPRFVVSNGGISPITKKIINSVNGEQVPKGGAGNKILMVLENRADFYLQDRALSRWDTCAGEAILEAIGGRLCKLTPFIEKGTIKERYHYKYTPELFGDELSENSDPNPDARASLFNIKIFSDDEAFEKKRFNKNYADQSFDNDGKPLLDKKGKPVYIGKQLKDIVLQERDDDAIKDKFVNNINICGLFAIKDRSNTELIGKIKTAVDKLIGSGEVFDY